MATNFKINAVLNPAGVVAGSRIASASLAGLNRQANILGGTFLRVFGVVGLGIGIKTSIDLIADFQQSVATATAIATRDFKSLEGNMASLSEEARRLGRTTRFTAKEAADGMLFLVRAGFTVNEVLAITKDTLLLAQAGNLGMGRAADIVTNVMAGFSVGVSEATRCVDVLAKAANTTNTTIQQLGDALKFAGPVAAAVGVSVEEAAAAIGALSNAGLQATLAGTGLRRVLSELEAPSSKAQKFLAKLGLEQKDIAVSTHGLVGSITKLIEAGFDVGDALEFFGDRGGPAFQVIKSAIEQGFIQRMTSEFLHAGGTARDIAKVMDETLKGALFALKSAFEAVILAMGELGTAGGLEDFIRGVTQLLRNMAKNIKLVTKLFQILASVIITLVVRKALVFLIAHIKTLNALMLKNRMGVMILAAIALTSALVAFSDQLSYSSNGIVTLEHVGLSVLQSLKETLAGFFIGMAEAFTGTAQVATSSGQVLTSVLLSTAQTIAQIADTIGVAFFGIFFAISYAFEESMGSITNILKIAANGWLKIFKQVANDAIATLNLLPGVDLDPVLDIFQFDVDKSKVKQDSVAFFQAFVDGFKAQLSMLPDELGLFGGEGGPIEAGFLNAIAGANDIAAAEQRLDKLQEIIDAFKIPDIDPGDKAKIKWRVLLENLDEEIRLLGLSADARERLRKVNQEAAGFEKGLQGVQRDALDTRFRIIQSLERQNQLYSSLASGQLEDLAQQERTLGQLYLKNRINLEEYTLALEEMRLQSLRFAQDIDSGEMRALIRVKQEIRDIATLTEDVLVGAFQAVEQSITDFVSTGEADFHRLAQTILAETTRIMLRLLMLKAFPGFFSTGVGALSPGGMEYFSPLGQFAQGGSFKVGGSGGTDSQPVGFMATPGERVDVSRSGQSPETQAAPVVNIRNVTVFDPEMALDALGTADGEKIIMNIINRNRDSVKAYLGA